MSSSALAHQAVPKISNFEPLVIRQEVGMIVLGGGSAAGKNHVGERLIRWCPGVDMIPSVTTRKLRPGGQDKEYRSVSPEEFERLRDRNRFLWFVEMHGNWYGTLGADIDDAIKRQVPSVIHLAHSRVSTLEKFYERYHSGSKKLFKLLVACNDEETILRRLRSRDSSIDPVELDRRFSNFFKHQDECLQSGAYDAVMWSRDDKTDGELFSELSEILS